MVRRDETITVSPCAHHDSKAKTVNDNTLPAPAELIAKI
jgi:hypothetical protein